mmetsp:Transcript_4341/g.10372  ORF Transcript_4341/g.10372 Transcript_4341/m.10372 type:complete len:126 (-) Transcript_4341:755-1132(-)
MHQVSIDACIDRGAACCWQQLVTLLPDATRALNEDKSHIPYMESKLTMLLRPAFGGSSRTYALITGSTDDKHMEETLQAVRFGEECSMISNHARQAASSLEGATKVPSLNPACIVGHAHWLDLAM